MNPLFRALDWSATAFNHAPWWKQGCTVWEQRMFSPTFERWLYLRLHRLGLMGRTERDFFQFNGGSSKLVRRK